jgi:AraC-like DNA-binding protein
VQHKKRTFSESHRFIAEPRELAGRALGPHAPRAWSARLRQLTDAARQPEEGPSWFTPVNAYFGSVETRTDTRSYFWDGMKRLGRRDLPHVYFQFTLAGFGHFELYGRPPQRIPPGTGFFAVLPSRHRYYLPEASPGWTFGWIGIFHPYLLRRIAKQVAATGPVIQTPPGSPLIKRAMRLVRGAFRKDFSDKFEVERELFDFTLEFERLAQEMQKPKGESLLEDLESRVLADPRHPVTVEVLAAEHGMSRSAFSHFFRARTGTTPAHFMTEVRVQKATRMLATTNLSLEEIASECGFANANHFGKVFRRFRQQSAGAYRHTIR